LVKYLVETFGYSRRRAVDLIKKSQVIVNGEMATSFTQTISFGDEVSVGGQKTTMTAGVQTITLMMHKPKGVLSATIDAREKTVLDILPTNYRNLGLFPAGRLDKDSTGLLIITNDGELAYRLTHPSFELEKEYYLACSRPLTDREVIKLEQGVDIYQGGRTSLAKIKSLTIDHLPFHYSIVIHEGKKRQIKRMFATLGNPITELQRVRVGRLVLPHHLLAGQVQELGVQEREMLT